MQKAERPLGGCALHSLGLHVPSILSAPLTEFLTASAGSGLGVDRSLFSQLAHILSVALLSRLGGVPLLPPG